MAAFGYLQYQSPDDEQLCVVTGTTGRDAMRRMKDMLESVDEMSDYIEYSGITDGVRKFIGLPNLTKKDIKVTEVMRIVNPRLQSSYDRVQREMFQPGATQKMFHGTSIDSIVNIVQEGFKLPSQPGMFGKGIYFACDKSKSAQYSIQKGSYMLLGCNVRIGKPLVLTSACNSMNLSELKRYGCDSVHAPGGTRGTGGVRRGEYVIYRPEQALPTHLVCFELKD